MANISPIAWGVEDGDVAEVANITLITEKIDAEIIPALNNVTDGENILIEAIPDASIPIDKLEEVTVTLTGDVTGEAILQTGGTVTIETTADGKQNSLVSGINIKTINGASVLGGGNLIINGDTPDQTNNGGKILSTDGNVLFWKNADEAARDLIDDNISDTDHTWSGNKIQDAIAENQNMLVSGKVFETNKAQFRAMSIFTNMANPMVVDEDTGLLITHVSAQTSERIDIARNATGTIRSVTSTSGLTVTKQINALYTSGEVSSTSIIINNLQGVAVAKIDETHALYVYRYPAAPYYFYAVVLEFTEDFTANVIAGTPVRLFVSDGDFTDSYVTGSKLIKYDDGKFLLGIGFRTASSVSKFRFETLFVDGSYAITENTVYEPVTSSASDAFLKSVTDLGDGGFVFKTHNGTYNQLFVATPNADGTITFGGVMTFSTATSATTDTDKLVRVGTSNYYVTGCGSAPCYLSVVTIVGTTITQVSMDSLNYTWYDFCACALDSDRIAYTVSNSSTANHVRVIQFNLSNGSFAQLSTLNITGLNFSNMMFSGIDYEDAATWQIYFGDFRTGVMLANITKATSAVSSISTYSTVKFRGVADDGAPILQLASKGNLVRKSNHFYSDNTDANYVNASIQADINMMPFSVLDGKRFIVINNDDISVQIPSEATEFEPWY